MKHPYYKAEDYDLLSIAAKGVKLRVTAIFTDEDDVTAHLAQSDDEVIAVFGPFIFLVNKYDKGL